MTSVDQEVEPDLDLDPEAEAPIEETREQQLSHLSLRELQQICKSPEYNLPANGKTTELIARIIRFEEEGIIDGDGPLPLKAAPPPPVAAAPAAPAPAAPAAQASPTPAPAPPAATPPAPPSGRQPKQKIGFFEAINTYRAEFPLGPRAQIDDPTHFQFIQDTHEAARAAGYTTKGYPAGGERKGFSVIRTDSGPMRSVIYEVPARLED